MSDKSLNTTKKHKPKKSINSSFSTPPKTVVKKDNTFPILVEFPHGINPNKSDPYKFHVFSDGEENMNAEKLKRIIVEGRNSFLQLCGDNMPESDNKSIKYKFTILFTFSIILIVVTASGTSLHQKIMIIPIRRRIECLLSNTSHASTLSIKIEIFSVLLIIAFSIKTLSYFRMVIDYLFYLVINNNNINKIEIKTRSRIIT
jgi:hypothetical protein